MANPRQPSEPSGSLFPQTRWTVVQRMGNGDSTLRITAWEEFCEAYWAPVHAWFKARGVDPATAQDLAQDFFVKIHGKPLTIQSLDPAKGRLRSYLFTALRHHLADHFRSLNAARRGNGSAHLPLDETIVTDACQSSRENDDQALFDREWALALTARTLRLIREEYHFRGSGPLFDALLTLLDPQPASVREAMRDALGFNENRFNAAVVRFRDRLATGLRTEVTHTLAHDDPSIINDELRHLIRLFARAGGVGALPPIP